MKKTIQFVAVTLILLAGGVLTGMAQNSNVVSPEFEMMLTNTARSGIIYRTQTCSPGGTFHVSFLGIFSGVPDVILCFVLPGAIPRYRNLGQVSAFVKAGVCVEDEGDYWFGCYVIDEHANPYFEYRLCVTLTVSGPPMAVITGQTDHLKMNKVSNPFAQLICTRTKSLIWRSKMLVLA